MDFANVVQFRLLRRERRQLPLVLLKQCLWVVGCQVRGLLPFTIVTVKDGISLSCANRRTPVGRSFASLHHKSTIAQPGSDRWHRSSLSNVSPIHCMTLLRNRLFLVELAQFVMRLTFYHTWRIVRKLRRVVISQLNVLSIDNLLSEFQRLAPSTCQHLFLVTIFECQKPIFEFITNRFIIVQNT